MATFDINNIFRKAFGYDMPEELPQIEKKPARKERSELGGSYYATDALGREFFLPVKIETYLIPFAVIGLTAKKTIVSTAMPERGGSVKELISIEDYLINIKGLLVSEDGTWPEDGVFDMHSIFATNRALKLECVLTDIILKKDQLVVVKECRWPPIAGVEHVRAFEMELESDMIFDLETVE